MKELSPRIGPEIYNVADYKTSEDLNTQPNDQFAVHPLITPGLEELQSPLVHGAKDKYKEIPWEHNVSNKKVTGAVDKLRGVNNEKWQTEETAAANRDEYRYTEGLADKVHERNLNIVIQAGGRPSRLGDAGHQKLSSLTEEQAQRLGEAMADNDQRTVKQILNSASRPIDGHHALPQDVEERVQENKRKGWLAGLFTNPSEAERASIQAERDAQSAGASSINTSNQVDRGSVQTEEEEGEGFFSWFGGLLSNAPRDGKKK